MANRSQDFGRLLKAGIGSIANCEGKTAPAIEEDLGQAIGVAANTILAEAIDLFERLGMRRKLAEARAELVRLEAGEA